MPLIALATSIIQAVTFGLFHEILVLIRKLYSRRLTKVLVHGGESGNNEKFQPGRSQEDPRLANGNTGDCTSLEISSIPKRRSQDRLSLPVCFRARLCSAGDNGNKNSKVVLDGEPIVPLERHCLLDFVSTHRVRSVHTHNRDDTRHQPKPERRGSSIMKNNLKYSSSTDEAQLRQNVLRSDDYLLLHRRDHVSAHSSHAESRWANELINERIEVHQVGEIHSGPGTPPGNLFEAHFNRLNDDILDIDEIKIHPASSEPVRRFNVCFRSQDEIIDDFSHFTELREESELGENDRNAGSKKTKSATASIQSASPVLPTWR